VERRAAELCPGLAEDPWLIGYYTDNEIRWVPDIRSNDSVLEAFLKKDPESPGYKKAVASIWTAEEIDLDSDMNDWKKLTRYLNRFL